MGILSRDEILGAADVVTEVVEVPEWGGSVVVKGLTGAERDRFESSVVQMKGKKTEWNMANVRARLTALAVVDREGKRLFKPGDVEALGAKSAAALDKVFSVAMRLAGLRQEDLDELTENFTDAPNGDSSSD